MKKLTEDHFKVLKSQYPVLSVEELARILGGDADVSWNCLFNCMYAIDPTRSVSDYVDIYIASTGCDPSQSGGVPPGSISGAFSVAGFSASNQMVFMNDKNITNVLVFEKNGLGHAVIATNPPRVVTVPKTDEKGNIIRDNAGREIMETKTMLTYKDPTTGKADFVYEEDIVTMYQVQKPKSVGSSSGSVSSDSSNRILTNKYL